MSILNNTTELQALLNKVNTLPEQNGIKLPELSNEGTPSDLLSGKQLIDGSGNIVDGTFTIDNELDTQGGLITQIATALVGKTSNNLDTSDATATSNDILKDKTAYVNDKKICGIIETKTSSDLIVDGATITVPSGYYNSNIEKSVSTTTQATPSITVNVTGLITASATQTSGYVVGGTKSTTKQLTTQVAKTITPTKSSQTAVDKNVYTTGIVTVAAIPDTYIQPTGTLSVTTNGTHDVKNYASVNVSIANSGGTTTQEYTNSSAIGSFTFIDDNNICRTFCFIIGMTWQEFINSSINYCSDVDEVFKDDTDSIQFYYGLGGSIYRVSLDGVNPVLPTDLIINEQEYILYDYYGWG